MSLQQKWEENDGQSSISKEQWTDLAAENLVVGEGERRKQML